MHFNRRNFLRMTGAAGAALAGHGKLGINVLAGKSKGAASHSLDRREVVRRHNPVVTRLEPYSALSVGNGEFAFTADATGLQTFIEPFEKEFPLCTMSHWGWHSTPLPSGLHKEDIRYKQYDTYGRPVGYLTDSKGQEVLFNWLRENPHRLHLGRIGFELKKKDGSDAKPEDINTIKQTLDLWTGILDSRFEFDDIPVHVLTCCHPELDMIAVSVESSLLSTGRLQVLLAFPYGSPRVNSAEWNSPGKHETRLNQIGVRRVELQRKLDEDRYCVNIKWSDGALLSEKAKHNFLLKETGGTRLEFVCLYSPAPHAGALPSAAQTFSASESHWLRFWNEGGAIDLGGSADPRAEELERRTVLSQYNTALHCAGSLPSQETGLLYNTWYGKFHLEMHWWHSVHFVAWNRFHLFEKNLNYYQRILPAARDIARRQGYMGVRWPKMVGPDGIDSPSPVGPLLIWQQPHPIYYAALCYRQRPTIQTLKQWQQIVFETAEFMASYPVLDPKRGKFVLGPPLRTVSENTETVSTINPTFELAYWRFGLSVAQQWRELLGLSRNPRWDEILKGLVPLPVKDGLYLMQEGMYDTYTKWNWEHPALLGVFGVQRGDGVDIEIMRRTVRRVIDCWQWERTWGWDFPMAAMAACRVGEPELAVKALMIDVPKNRYHLNGHNYQREGLTAYLPGNGGLLAAVAMMAAGWEGGPDNHAPGFPSGNKWSVKFEDIKPWRYGVKY